MQNKKEELQSRREFFKKAAKAALPVVGAVVLSNLPVLKTEAAPMGCDSGCWTGCYGSCHNGCYSSCSGGCKYSCSGSCSGNCMNTCIAYQANTY